MNNDRKVVRLKDIISFCLTIALLASSSMFVLAAPENKPLAGEITVSGNRETSVVTLNGERAYSGRTFFSSGVIETADSSAVINLGKLGRISVEPNSVLSLNFTENNISGKLSAGRISVFNREGVTVNIEKIDNAEVALENEESGAAPQTGQTTAASRSSLWVPILIYSAIVGTAVVYTITNGSDDDLVVSPVR